MRAVAVLSAFTSAAMLASLSAAHASTPLATWASTATQGLPLSNLTSAVDLGPLPVSEPLTVRIALAPQNKAALVSFVKAANTPGTASFGQYLTPAQFKATYGASAAQVNSVVSYLESAGLSSISVEPNNLLISANGSAAQIEAAFNTKLESISQLSTPGYVNLTAAQVPASLSGVVTAVLGLNSIGQMRSTLSTRAAAKPATNLPSTPSLPQYDVSYNPKQFQAIYSATTTPTGANASIAIMAEGNLTQVVTDLRTEEKAFGLPQVPVSIVPVGLASSDTSGADEWDLDTQYSSGMAETLKELYIYDTTSLSDSDLALEFSRWATDKKALAASASLGECEIFPYLDGSMTVDDMTFLEAAAQGQTFFASAGDTGSFCPAGAAGANGVPAGAPFVNYPASSPYVVAVGGTTLLTTSTGAYDYEIAWYSGGGGLSQFEEAGEWQSSANLLINETGDRGVPDISLDADPYSGATVYVDGTPEGVGGTSLSSPLALGLWARALSAKPKFGFASPVIYSLYDSATTPGSYPKGGFHDITLGANGLYTAVPGYDLTTGLGSPIASQFEAAFE